MLINVTDSKIFLILDNLRAHSSKLLKAWLADQGILSTLHRLKPAFRFPFSYFALHYLPILLVIKTVEI
ncbi:hypothetical protein METHB2_1050006 [Candidatus Methylobacter favarea]|uniref:Uncharacterized protein n=1 Tax=Candidatus Methylobacter favarea TaxID=2707345 RepID=A0A8S0WM24_9GAMM|nr:hypothetical protein METHB2_1050006 [Candidatus Methylobacter favarea]